MSTLSQTTVLVTGAAGGLGQAIAQAYIAAGANVAICDINQERLDAASTQWGSKHGDKFLALKADVTDEASVEKMFADTVSKFGTLNILVNNAGIMDKFDPVGSCDKSTWDRVLAVNLTGSFLATKAAVNQFEKQGQDVGGIVVNIGSNASYTGMSAGVAYTASKHGIVALTKSTAGFYGSKGIYSIALLLGGMEETNIVDAFAAGMNQEAFGKMSAVHPGFVSGKTGVPVQDVAKYVVFLSDRSIALSANGSCIPFNRNWPEA